MNFNKCVLFLVFIVCGCANLQIPPGFQYKNIATADFDISVWQKITADGDSYKIYIEGDGYAFDAGGQPTSDPTPRGIFMRKLAFEDKHNNVVYMARVCQFTQAKKCEQKYWTGARFAPEVIAAQAEAIKKIIGNNSVTLVGFSGGAQIAGLVAVKYPEIKVNKIITIAGNLDHQAWTECHNVPPLDESLKLTDYRAEFLQIPQIHYVGTKDEVMPPQLNRDFVNNKAVVIEVKNATHNSGWDSVVAEIHEQ